MYWSSTTKFYVHIYYILTQRCSPWSHRSLFYKLSRDRNELWKLNRKWIIYFQILTKTNDHSLRVLTGAAKNFNTWMIKATKMKAIYHAMNMFNVDVMKKCLIAECWAPTKDIQTVNNMLLSGSVSIYNLEIYLFVH